MEKYEHKKREPLHMSALLGYVTKTVSYKGTICNIDSEDAVLRIINAKPDPQVKKVQQCQVTFMQNLEQVIPWFY